MMAACAAAQSPAQFVDRVRDSEFLREAGPYPTIDEGQEVPRCVLRSMRFAMKYPSSLVIENATKPIRGLTPGNRPCWIVDAAQSGTNSYGARVMGTLKRYFIQKDAIKTTKLLY